MSLQNDQVARLDRYWTEWRGSLVSKPAINDQRILRTQYRVSDFVAWKRNGALDLNPNFQRRPVWKKGAKSYLIDTILRGLPMPIIFLRDLRTDLRSLKAKRDVVDGQQRIRTIFSYIDPELLSDYKPEHDDFTISATHNKDLAGLSFAQLTPDYKQQIMDYQFSVHSFPADTDDRDILQIFARMNSTGVKLNAQEIRNAEFSGPFKTLAYKIATEQLYRWREWGVFSPYQIARMNEVELSSEFMLLILNGILGKKDTVISDYYDFYEERELPDGPEITHRFRSTFDVIESLIEPPTIRSYFTNRTLFYALFTTIYGLQYGLRKQVRKEDIPRLAREKPKPIKPEIIEHIIKAGTRIAAGDRIPPQVSKALRGATSDPSPRQAVIKFLAGKDNNPCRRSR